MGIIGFTLLLGSSVVLLGLISLRIQEFRYKEKAPVYETDIEWPEFIKCLEEQFGFDLTKVVESDMLLEEFSVSIEAQYGVDLEELLTNLKVHAVALCEDTDKYVECTIGGE